ncbi:MAG: M15 family metallopeptidase [Bifidobacteriaceae bacterium]|jgi:D-alanyl-D-alanine carboxypeptidase|nr:M15 family metallopeptidase [Bifidobacteriaceae bacterium]
MAKISKNINYKTIILSITILGLLAGGSFASWQNYNKDKQIKILEKQINDIYAGSQQYSKDHPQFLGETSQTPETMKEPFSINGIIIADKKHPLPKDYNPGENPEAVKQLKKLIEAGQKSGDKYASHLVYDYSGFRSYDYQIGVYNEYIAQSGQQFADDFSARPGYSEHQTGLAFDLRVTGSILYRGDDKTYDYYNDWVAQNAHNFGFIVRYRDQWQNSTGYKGEPWHLRYLGQTLATDVFKSDKPLEDYLAISGGNYTKTF